MMKTQYRTTAEAVKGRTGSVIVEGSPLKFDMAPPAEMGGTGKEGTNPEQLFAAGYAACFGSALQHVVRVRKLPIPTPAVRATVSIGTSDAGNYELAVEITATIPGVEQSLADELVKEAHIVCPYSNAVRNNIDVQVTAKTE